LVYNIRCIYEDVIKTPGIHKNTKPIMHPEQKKKRQIETALRNEDESVTLELKSQTIPSHGSCIYSPAKRQTK